MDVREIFSRVPEITGLPLTRKGDHYLGSCYMDGTLHNRSDKLDIAIKMTDNGYKILLLENGGDCITLESWLLQYGGAKDWKEVRDIMSNKGWSRSIVDRVYKEFKPVPTKYISEEDMEKEMNDCMDGYCNLLSFLVKKFGEDAITELLNKFLVTCDKYGNTVFWYIDINGRICKDKRVKYLSSGKRKKDTKYPFWSKFKAKNGYNGKAVFGEHLIKGKKQVCVVESEKTALICSIYYPEKLWVAIGGKNRTSLIQQGWLLYPDYDARHEWSNLGRVEKWWEGEEVEGNMDIGDLILKKI